ncbi:MAG: hypothetical protein EON60_00515 [Alphaproteobacteria bacterium]|nr:MAG: hypothetical protein EON60_00515 [Alphaproteobacteria bacterium]
MNLWQNWAQNWLSALTQSQQSATQAASSLNAQFASQLTGQYAAQWQQACQQWQKNMEGAWSAPASFWQTVASIQSARARCIAEICQQHPAYVAQLFQCTSFPQLIECLSRWHGHTLSSIISLNVVTQAQRSHLWSQWQQQMPFNSTSQAALNKMWNTSSFWSNSTSSQQPFSNFGNTSSGNQQRSSSQPQPQAKPTPQPTPATQSQPAAQQSQPQQTQQVQPPQQNQPVASVLQQTAPQQSSTQLSSTGNQLNLINNENPTISSTANSVMRASNGNTVAAAAAARRSVVARRVANNRRRVVR